MLQALIEKEFKELLNTKKFIVSFIVVAFLILLTFYIGSENHKVNQRQYEAFKAENIRSMKGLTDWRMAKHKIFLPPQPLASLVSGISNDIGRKISVEGRGELTPEISKYNEEPVYAVFRFLDLNFLFQVILTLFAMLFTYNAVNGEKESGTLKLVFSGLVPRSKFILAKSLGSFLSIITLLIIPILLGILILPLNGIALSGEEYIKLSLVIAGGLLLVGVFIMISVFFSTFTARSANSFLYSLVFWILAILVIPRVSVLIAGRAVEVPPVDEINSKKAVYSRQLGEEMMNKLTNFSVEPGDNMMNEFNKFMEEINTERTEKMRIFSESLKEQRRNKQIVQENLAFTIARISPAACFQLAANNIAGTSMDLVREYEEQANNYQKIYADFQIEKSGGTTGSGLTLIIQNDGPDVKEIDSTELPKFQFKQASLAKALSGSVVNLSLLVLFIILIYAGAYFMFLRFDLR